MSHFGHSVKITNTTPKEWLRTGKEISDLVNKWSQRGDIVALVNTEISAPVPALFNPKSAEVEVNLTRSFGAVTPEMVGDLTIRKYQFENPKAVGAIFHEACHARFSRYDLEAASKRLTPNQHEALMALEESRAEGWGVKAMPENRAFLKSCALEIAIGDAIDQLDKMDSVRGAAYLSALALARVDAGVLDDWDVAAFSSAAERVLGGDVLNQLREIWIEFQAHSEHSNFEPLLPLAIKWDEIVSKVEQEHGQGGGGDGEGDQPEGGCEFPSGDGKGKGKGKGVGDILGDLLDALADDAEQTSFSAGRDLADQEQIENYAETAKAKSSAAKQNQQHKKVYQQIIEQEIKRGGEPNGNTNSRLLETRKANSAERRAAVLVGQMLEKAKYRERDLTIRSTTIPAGRLRTRGLVQQAALREIGVNQQVEAWRQKVRKQTDEPTLSIGVMVDISGSMGHAMKPMASTAWIMSEAGRRVQAKTAMFYYGQSVFPTLKVGQHLTDVSVWSANDYTEKFDEAFQALDGGLNLLDGTGARLLVIVSDGEYTQGEREAARKWVRECQRSGVGVVWISYHKQNRGARFITNGTDTVLADLTDDLTEAALLIGKAAVDAMNKVGVRKMA